MHEALKAYTRAIKLYLKDVLFDPGFFLEALQERVI